ncbi:MAG: hypothetical protein HOO06_00030 [Bdellovibrionaceae bacterium]|jgi:hypothetical protein|nr:hypothetical protein [Pseudobdellovibrionaceae bacterium]
MKRKKGLQFLIFIGLFLSQSLLAYYGNEGGGGSKAKVNFLISSELAFKNLKAISNKPVFGGLDFILLEKYLTADHIETSIFEDNIVTLTWGYAKICRFDHNKKKLMIAKDWWQDNFSYKKDFKVAASMCLILTQSKPLQLGSVPKLVSRAIIFSPHYEEYRKRLMKNIYEPLERIVFHKSNSKLFEDLDLDLLFSVLEEGINIFLTSENLKDKDGNDSDAIVENGVLIFKTQQIRGIWENMIISFNKEQSLSDAILAFHELLRLAHSRLGGGIFDDSDYSLSFRLQEANFQID